MIFLFSSIYFRFNIFISIQFLQTSNMTCILWFKLGMPLSLFCSLPIKWLYPTPVSSSISFLYLHRELAIFALCILVLVFLTHFFISFFQAVHSFANFCIYPSVFPRVILTCTSFFMHLTIFIYTYIWLVCLVHSKLDILFSLLPLLRY